MKDMSFFLLKNVLGAKMRKGFKNFCHSDASTSTLDQHKSNGHEGPDNPYIDDSAFGETQPTLEQMIIQLDLEEKFARRAKLDENVEIKHRMSCVNSSDILRTARNALNQYPRFSLDGKDSMYRSSFQNMPPINTSSRKSSCGSNEVRKVEKIRHMPSTLAGESVVWCKPGVVAKLMGLDAIPVPLFKHGRNRLNAIIKRQNLRRKAERYEMERRVLMNATRRAAMTGSCSRPGYCSYGAC